MSATTPRRRVAAVAVVLSATLALALGPGQDAASALGVKGQMLRITNASRHRFGLRDLRIDWHLSRQTMRHTEMMAESGDLEHTLGIVRFLPGDWMRWGENIGYTTGTLGDLQRAFMHSPSHRANVLNRTFRRVGIGVVKAGGRIWVTLDFYG